MAITNKIAPGTTLTAAGVLGNGVRISKTDAAALELKMQGDAAETLGVTFTFARSADGTTYETTPRFTWVATLNGTTAVVAYTNLSNAVIGPAAYLKCVSIVSAATNANATNVTLRVLTKTLKPSP